MKLDRIALNMDQVEQYSPPPNPAKQTDSRFEAYMQEFGDESWELDALEPTVLSRLITDTILSVRDEKIWEAAREQELDHRAQLAAVSDDWDNITENLDPDTIAGLREHPASEEESDEG